jgi:CheY-like chemotaxis protein
MLRDESYRMTFSHNGATTLKNVTENKYDLILLDILMPEMDVFEVCKALKGSLTTAVIPEIFLTAKDAAEDIVKGFEAGAADYVDY